MLNLRQSDHQHERIVLPEWSNVGPAECPQLHNLSFRDDATAQKLAKSFQGRVDIREGYEGLEVSTNSFVGRLEIGPLRITIQPKLPNMPLATLLRYAYGLRDVATLDKTLTPVTRHGLHDLLIVLLAAEVEELLYRGLARRYELASDALESPRGRILIERIAKNGGFTEAKLACAYFERQTNWHLNQTLRAGLGLAAKMTEDRELRLRLHQLARMFGDVEQKEILRGRDLDEAVWGLNRLTAASAPALTIIRLLSEMKGVSLETKGEWIHAPGFLFDMNLFFQRLLSRFLRENLFDRHIKDELSINSIYSYSPNANSKRQTLPKPRPDFALFKATQLIGFLDAKYRDIWEKGLPAHWLYQLSIYALASPNQTSILLYATMSMESREERIDIRQPISGRSDGSAHIILRPVSLQRLAKLLSPDPSSSVVTDRRQFARELVVFDT